MEVESGGNLNAVGNNGKAIGPFQILKSYWTDAAEEDPTLKAGAKGYENCKGSGSVNFKERYAGTYVFKIVKVNSVRIELGLGDIAFLLSRYDIDKLLRYE